MKAEAVRERAVEYDGKRIAYHLTRDKRKRMRITVKPDLTVSVAVPRRARDSDVDKFVHSKARWITRKLEQMAKFHPLPEPLRYVSGETLRFLGRQYRLKVEQGARAPAKLRGKFLYVNVPKKDDRKSIKQAVDAWYRVQAERTFDRYMQNCMKVASRHGLPEAHLKLRKMRSRWGSCSSKGNITLNTNLVRAPVHCIEYVVMHELCHLKHHNHSRAFYKLLTQCMPDWEGRKRDLEAVVIRPE